MTVQQLINILSEYNPNAIVETVADNMSSDFDISYGTSEGCEKKTCDTVYLWSQELPGTSEQTQN